MNKMTRATDSSGIPMARSQEPVRLNFRRGASGASADTERPALPPHLKVSRLERRSR